MKRARKMISAWKQVAKGFVVRDMQSKAKALVAKAKLGESLTSQERQFIELYHPENYLGLNTLLGLPA